MLSLQSPIDQMNESTNKRHSDDEDRDAYGNEDDDFSSSEEDAHKRRKRKKKKKKKELKGIITTLLLQEEQEKRDQEETNKESLEERLSFDASYKKRSNSTVDYYSNFQSYYTENEENDRVKKRKSRGAKAGGVAVAAAAAAAAEFDETILDKRARHGSKNQEKQQQQQRRLWVKDRSNSWWDECNSPDFPEDKFKAAFRMSRFTFDMICEELNSVIAKEDTTLRNAIPVRQRVAVCIWRLATGEALRLVSKKFGLGISTCHKLVLEVCSAIRNVLMPRFLQWPDEDGLRKIKEEFESNSGIPNVVGSMYTTHIPIIAPKISVTSYFNKRHTERKQKTSYSITVQGVVDPKGVFRDVCIGWPGSMTDDQVLEKSALYQRASAGSLKGVWIVGGSGYPLMDWVLVPYNHKRLTWTQHAFNEKIGEIQKVAKDYFTRLKRRWCCLQKRTEVKLQDLPVVLGACCVLHNICELRNEGMDPELDYEVFDDEMVPEVPLRSVSSVKARDAIAHNLLHHGLAGTSFL